MEKYENLDKNMKEESESLLENKDSEKLIQSSPRLKNIYNTLSLLEKEELPSGEKIDYKTLHENVKPFSTMLEFSDNVKEEVRDYVSKKIVNLKEKIPSFKDINDNNLLDALTRNWFEEAGVSGMRKEVLLAVAAHVVKRIETETEQSLLKKATPEKLSELGIEPPIRDLICDLLDVSLEADPLFIRFLAYSQLSGKPSEDATPTGLNIPGDKKTHAIAELFPHESQFLARHLGELSEKESKWKEYPGGKDFAEYLGAIKEFYSSKDSVEALEIQNKIMECYAKVSKTDFPVLLVPGMEGYYKEPYIDPELRVCISVPETNRETESFEQAKEIMANNLNEIGAEKFSDNVKKMEIKSSIVLGGFGVNLAFNAVAQEDPFYHLFLNEQIFAYDRYFPKYVSMINNSDETFSNISGENKNNYLEKMSRVSTMLHEFGHQVYPYDSEDGKRLGRKPLTIIDEVKAETLWRSLIPEMVKDDGFLGNKEQWATATLASLALMAKDPEAYSDSAVFNLNALFDEGVVKFENEKLSIVDVDKYFSVEKQRAEKVLGLYMDKTMTEHKAAAWIKKECVPSDSIESFLSFVRSLPN